MVGLMPAGAAGYGRGLAVNPPGAPSSEQAAGLFDKAPRRYWTHSKIKRRYTEYLHNKRLEIREQKESREYRHGAQWTTEQIAVFNKRKQPVVTYNRISRKIDGITGHVEKLKQDPKAYARKADNEMQADLATASLRCCLDEARWADITPFIAATAATEGIGGVEMVLEDDEFGGKTIGFEDVDIEGFFYDPRSRKADFSDAAYMGCGRWIDLDIAKSMFPGHADKLDNVVDDYELTSSAASDVNWSQGTGELKTVRIVCICYQHEGDWCYAIFTGSDILMEGKSEFTDKRGKTICKYLMFSAAVDHDRDRYGFVRNLKSPQDEVNQRRSKGLHLLNVRQIIAEKGAFDDIEEARREAARPDGVVERNKGFEAEFNDAMKHADLAAHIKLGEEAKTEMENFGPNPALLGDTGISNRSGRAISLMQQAGIAELGPYLINYRSWKLRVYRAVFEGIKRYWTHERYIRISDVNGGQDQRIPVNQLTVNQMGAPTIVNPMGQLDVDIVLDEGPDSVTMQQDLFETLQQIIPGIAPMLSPPLANALVEMLLTVSPLDSVSKKKLSMAQQQAQQPDPVQQQAQQLELADRGAKIEETKSKTVLNFAKANSEGMPDQQGAADPEDAIPPELQIAQTMVQMDESRAGAQLKRSQAMKHEAEAQAAPMKMFAEQRKVEDDSAAKQAQARKAHSEANILPFDLAQRAYDAAADRKVAMMKPKAAGSG